MNLRDIEYFVRVAEKGHFSTAAELCHVSQPTLSGQLRKLEEELGHDLFERDTRNVRLSHFGREILPLAQKVLGSVADMYRKSQELQDPMAGQVSLGAFPTLAPWILPVLAPVLGRSFPQSELFLVEEKSPVLIAHVLAGQVDAALLAMPVDKDGLTVQPLFREDFLVAMPDSHPWASRRSLTAEELAGTELLLLSDGHCLRDQALDLCKRYGATEGDRFRATSLETLRQMVRMGRGITLIPRLAIPECAEPGISYVEVQGGGFHRDIGLWYRTTHPRSAFFNKMAATIRDLCGKELETAPLEATVELY